MKYLDAYKDPHAARDLLDRLRCEAAHPWVILEVCGGLAHHLLRLGGEREFPENIELIHGPGCPVSSIPAAYVDRAIAIASRPGVILGAPGDLLRVPGTRGQSTLLEAQTRGSDVRAIYTPLDALALAKKHPDRKVVGLAVGFETTAPTAAAALLEAERLGLENLTLMTCYFRLAPAIEALLGSAGSRAQAVLAPGPVAAVTGLAPFLPLSEQFQTPVIVTGPGPVDWLEGLSRAVRQLEAGEFTVENQYTRAVRPDGNPQALAAISTVFAPSDAVWRGLGLIPGSGLALRERFRRFDAAAVFPEAVTLPVLGSECREADVAMGRLRPTECAAFGTRCSPMLPMGAGMVSAEGICAAYHRFRRVSEAANAPAANAQLPVLPAPSYPGA